MRPSLVLLAGANSAGKSTLYQTRVAPSFAGPFINSASLAVNATSWLSLLDRNTDLSAPGG